MLARLRALGVLARVSWRGVQHDPAVATPTRVADRRQKRALDDEVEDVSRIAPEVPFRIPSRKPNTGAAIAAIASVGRVHPGRGAQLRDALSTAYWEHDEDIGDPATIVRLAEEVGIPGFVDLASYEGRSDARAWEREWTLARLGGVPRLVRDDGKIIWNLVPVAELRGWMG
ncbi:MAG: hypothetical protein K2X99_08040 [Gemmatimonadaceae bacterium]|nr:hypothetical protein [Gemmatimonadaceae bacterium]